MARRNSSTSVVNSWLSFNFSEITERSLTEKPKRRQVHTSSRYQVKLVLCVCVFFFFFFFCGGGGVGGGGWDLHLHLHGTMIYQSINRNLRVPEM